MKPRPTLDVSGLPEYNYDSHAPLWWGNLMMIFIEGTIIAIVIATYFYLRQNFSQWPPVRVAPPDLLPGTAQLAVLLLSLIPVYRIDQLTKRGGSKRDVLIWLGVYFIFAISSIVIRFYEFPAMNCGWSDHAYGSIVWTALGLHLGHLLSSTIETLVLTIYLLGHEFDGKRRVDLNSDGLYWYFVVAAWIPLYVMLYLVPRYM
jgi:cytochrome c oxidase subunit I+III